MNINKEDKLNKMIFPIITNDVSKLPFYVTTIGSLGNQYRVLRQGGLPDYQILYTTQGKGHLRMGNKEFDITPNMGFYFEPGVPHEYYAEEEPWTTWWITFNGYATSDFSVLTDLGKYLVFHVHEMDRLYLWYSDIFEAAEYPGLTAKTDSSYHLYRLLLGLNNCIGTEAKKSMQFKNNQLQSALTYLNNNYANDITLADLAGIAGISKQHLCRLFRQTFNMRPFEYLTKCRLQNAKELLVGSDNFVLKEIASITGFNDVSYFCSVFKQYEGMTPIEFRRIHKKER